jgi:hypothetical protein
MSWVDRPAERDMFLLWVAVSAPTNGPFTGVFSLDGSDIGSYVASGFVAQGRNMSLQYWTSVRYAAGGTITISQFTDGDVIEGSFVADFANGTVSGDFTAPFCSKCQ